MYYDPQSAGINVQSPQSELTPRRLTLFSAVSEQCALMPAGLRGWWWQDRNCPQQRPIIGLIICSPPILAGEGYVACTVEYMHRLSHFCEEWYQMSENMWFYVVCHMYVLMIPIVIRYNNIPHLSCLFWDKLKFFLEDNLISRSKLVKYIHMPHL